MTPAQLAEDIERRNREAQAVFRIANGETGMNPIVSEALRGAVETLPSPVAAPASGNVVSAPSEKIDTTPRRERSEPLAEPVSAPGGLGTVTNPSPAGLARGTAPTHVAPIPEPAATPAGATIPLSGGLAGGLPFVAGQPEAKPSAPAQQAPEVETPSSSFYDMLMRNDAVRQNNKEAWDRREKADRARLAIASVTDALASLGNLVGTTQGAFNQPQTYQVPFVQQDVEAARAEARRYADLLERNDQSLRLAQAREDAANSAYALRQALEEERTRRAQLNNEARAALSAQNASQKADLYGVQHGYRTEEETQKQEGRMAVQESRNKQSDTNNRRTTATSRENTKDRIAAQQANGGGGKVGGYTTETTIHRDEYGQETGRTTTRTPANGGPSTTTTSGSTSGSGKKPNPMGGAPKEEGKKKKKNPMA